MQTTQQTTISRVQRRAQFILKLHSIILSSNSKIIRWSSDGLTFTIKDPAMFEEKLLSEICSHNTFASFERQIHFYSFERMGEHETQPSKKRFKKGSAMKYRHPLFYRNSTKENLMTIVRRTTPTQQRKVLAKDLKMIRCEASHHNLQYTRLQHIYQALQSEIEDRQNAAEAKAKAIAEEKVHAEYEQEQKRKKARLLATPAVTPPTVVSVPAVAAPVVSVSNDALLTRVDSLEWGKTMKMLDRTSNEILQYGSSFNQNDDTHDVTNILDDYIMSDYNMFQQSLACY